MVEKKKQEELLEEIKLQLDYLITKFNNIEKNFTKKDIVLVVVSSLIGVLASIGVEIILQEQDFVVRSILFGFLIFCLMMFAMFLIILVNAAFKRLFSSI